jgi:hypothetical protein
MSFTVEPKVPGAQGPTEAPKESISGKDANRKSRKFGPTQPRLRNGHFLVRMLIVIIKEIWDWHTEVPRLPFSHKDVNRYLRECGPGGPRLEKVCF